MNTRAQYGASASNRLSDKLRAVLQTRYEDVYELSQDGLTYVRPASLLGVPVARSGEGSAYWRQGWSSLDAYIEGEQREEDLKARAQARLSVDPSDVAAKKERKLRSDNVSKQRKIREVFGGDERPHPNQVVAKRFLPPEGLCEQELMYHLGCKMTDLTVLASQNLLAMDPWDFYRWRISRALMERLRTVVPGTASSKIIRGVINSLDGENGSDPLFREAVLHSADLQGRAGSFGPRKKKTTQDYAQAGKIVNRAVRTQRRTPMSFRNPAPAAAPTQSLMERRARRKQQQQSSTYQGVNAFRQAQKARGNDSTNGNGSSSETARYETDSDHGQNSSSRF